LDEYGQFWETGDNEMNPTFWQEIAIQAGSSALAVTIFMVLFGAFIKYRLSRQLEEFKQSLQQKMLEYQIRFSSLHEKRAEVLGELYGRLKQFQVSVDDLISPMEGMGIPPKKELTGIVNKRIDAFQTYLRRNRIYLPENLCEQIDSAYVQMRYIAGEFAIYIHEDESNIDTNLMKQKMKIWHEGWKKMSGPIPETVTKLESEFRKLIDLPAIISEETS